MNPVPPQPPGATGSNDRNWAVIAHLCAFLCFWTAIGNLLGPLIIWLIKREESPFIENQAREALNAQISFTAYAFVAGILLWVLIGFVLLPLVLITGWFLAIRAAMAASRGQAYRYPLIFRLVS